MDDLGLIAEKLAKIDDPLGLLQDLFTHTPVACQIFDVNGYCLASNQAVTELFGTAPAADYNILQDETAIKAGHAAAIRRAFGGETVKLPVTWYDPSRAPHVSHPSSLARGTARFDAPLARGTARDDGTTRRVAIEVTFTPLRDRGGAVRHVSLFSKDCTAEVEVRRSIDERELAHLELQRLEAQARQTQAESRLKSEFLANMSHELRTPLNAILGFAELIADNLVPMGSPQYKEFLGHILGSGRHLLRLINDVLDLTKVEAGRMDFRPETVDLARLVHEVRDVLDATGRARHVQVNTFCDPSLKDAFIDPARFKQVLFNYLSNALKFSHEGGTVEIRLLLQGSDTFRLEVQDSGIGIAPENRERLFIEFQQLEPGSAKRHSGAGLGLALTKRLVEAQGGQLGVESELGHGSTFYAVLPLRAPLRAPHAPLRSIAPPEPDSQSSRILVVDDDFASLRLMEAALRELGYDPIGAADAEHGLALAEKFRPSCIVLDLLMPGTDGFQLLAKLREQPSQKETPVIVWTVKDLTAAESETLANHTGAVLTKGGGDRASLIAQLSNVLPKHPG